MHLSIGLSSHSDLICEQSKYYFSICYLLQSSTKLKFIIVIFSFVIILVFYITKYKCRHGATGLGYEYSGHYYCSML